MSDCRGLAAYMEKEGIDAAVATCFPFRDGGLIRLANDYVLDTARTDSRIIPFIVVDRHDEKGALTEAERCFAQGARGVGEIAWYEGAFGEAERKGLEGLARYMEQTGMVFMMHLNEQVGHPYPGKTAADFGEVARLIQDHPSLKVILAHLGGGICFYEFMPEIRKAFPLVYYDLAAAPFLYSEALYRFAAAFLADKVLFGSDYPLLTLGRYRPRLDELAPGVREKFLWGNGRRLFGG
jgi:predicted TIM-barrel fold metal-dependent hydrolase